MPEDLKTFLVERAATRKKLQAAVLTAPPRLRVADLIDRPLDQGEEMYAGKLLREAGYKRSRMRWGGQMLRIWVRDEDDASDLV